MMLKIFVGLLVIQSIVVIGLTSFVLTHFYKWGREYPGVVVIPQIVLQVSVLIGYSVWIFRDT